MPKDFPGRDLFKTAKCMSSMLFNIDFESVVREVQKDFLSLKIGGGIISDDIINTSETEDQVKKYNK